MNYIPQGLSKQSKKIWHCLWEHSPKFVDAKALAEKLGGERTGKPISDAVYKLEHGLENEAWMIRHSYSRGEYALVPRQIN
ncbi:MAG: hypothetical protein ABFS56_24405 [Pseudomonadota bacterium]